MVFTNPMLRSTCTQRCSTSIYKDVQGSHIPEVLERNGVAYSSSQTRQCIQLTARRGGFFTSATIPNLELAAGLGKRKQAHISLTVPKKSLQFVTQSSPKINYSQVSPITLERTHLYRNRNRCTKTFTIGKHNSGFQAQPRTISLRSHQVSISEPTLHCRKSKSSIQLKL